MNSLNNSMEILVMNSTDSPNSLNYQLAMMLIVFDSKGMRTRFWKTRAYYSCGIIK